ATRSEALIAQFGRGLTMVPWRNREAALAGIGMLVNSTSLGMTGHPTLDLDLAKLPPDALVSDIVYAPLETDLLRQARQRDNPVLDGIGMLLHQAKLGFTEWFGIAPEVDDALKAAVLQVTT